MILAILTLGGVLAAPALCLISRIQRPRLVRTRRQPDIMAAFRYIGPWSLLTMLAFRSS